MSKRERQQGFRRRLSRTMPRLAALRRRLRMLSVPLRDVMKNKHRFVVIDNYTYKEKFSFQLTGSNIIVAIAAVVIVLILITNVLIIFTPLRQLIPGYINNDMVEQTYRNAQKIDSLEHEVERQNLFIANMKDVIMGKEMPSVDDVRRQSDSTAAAASAKSHTYSHSVADSMLRVEMRERQRSNTVVPFMNEKN